MSLEILAHAIAVQDLRNSCMKICLMFPLPLPQILAPPLLSPPNIRVQETPCSQLCTQFTGCIPTCRCWCTCCARCSARASADWSIATTTRRRKRMGSLTSARVRSTNSTRRECWTARQSTPTPLHSTRLRASRSTCSHMSRSKSPSWRTLHTAYSSPAIRLRVEIEIAGRRLRRWGSRVAKSTASRRASQSTIIWSPLRGHFSAAAHLHTFVIGYAACASSTARPAPSLLQTLCVPLLFALGWSSLRN